VRCVSGVRVHGMTTSSDRSLRHRERQRSGLIVLDPLAADELLLVDLLIARGFLSAPTENKSTITAAFERLLAKLLAESAT
jgi:hypothetical protein